MMTKKKHLRSDMACHGKSMSKFVYHIDDLASSLEGNAKTLKF